MATVIIQSSQNYDVKDAIADNRLVGLWRLLRGFRLYYIGAGIGLGISALARTGAMLLLAYFVDEVLIRDDVTSIVPFIALGFFVLAIIQGGASFISGRLAARTAETIALKVRNYLYDHLQRLSFTYHDKTPTGELLQRATSDVDAIRRFYVEHGVGIIRITLLFIVNFTVIMTINVQLALISAVTIPLLFLVSIFFFYKLSKKYEAFQDQEAKLSTTLQENLSGIRVVKAFARQAYAVETFEEKNWRQFERGRDLAMMHAYFWPLTDLLTGFQLLAGYVVGALMVMDGQILIGQYLGYAGMVIMIIYPMRDLGRLIANTSTGLVSYDRVMEIIKENREPLEENAQVPVNEIRGDIVFDNVSFQYAKDAPALHNINFECKSGQVIALLGSTGSGKTSLANLLPRFYDYTQGSITLDGIELRDYPRRFLRDNIGIVEQEPFLFSRTIRENIAYSVGRPVTDEEIESVARTAAIHEVIVNDFPEGYETLVGERGVTLSGGQKQRLALARTLLKNPRLLILDDATSSVDTETEEVIRTALKNLMQDRTSFIIAHRIQSVMHADLILVFDKGRIIQMGTHQDLFVQDGIYRQTYEMQSRIDEELEKEIANAR